MSKRFFAPGATKLNMKSDEAIIARLQQKKAEQSQEPDDISEKLFFESVTEDMMLEATSKMADQTLRSNAAAAVITWIDGEDATYEELDSLLYGFAAGDDDQEELTEDELEVYNALLEYVDEFLVANGADASQVQSMDENEDAAEAVFNDVKESIKAKDDDELIADFAVRETMMNESTQKVVRDGKVVTKKKKTKKHKQSPAQKAALKKAQKKSNSSAAKAQRRKSNRVRKSRGM